jgi:hypothetical protein
MPWSITLEVVPSAMGSANGEAVQKQDEKK